MTRRFIPVATALVAATLLAAPAFGAGAGSLDPTFGGDGKVTTSFPGYNDAGGTGTALRSGRFAVIGDAGTATDTDFALGVYKTNGVLDKTFSRDGRATVGFDGASERSDLSFDVTIQSDGKIVAVGQSEDDLVLVRWKSTGKLDGTFAGSGKIRQDLGGDEDLHAVGLGPNGTIVGAGSKTGEVLVVRYRANGTLDPTFGGGDGWVTLNLGNTAVSRGVIARGSGAIFVVGQVAKVGGGTQAFILRLDSTGSPDNTFDGDGIRLEDFGSTLNDVFYDAMFDANGRLVVAGRADDLVVGRYLTDGTPDAAFGSGGFTTVPVGDNGSGAFALAFTDAGKIVVAGFTSPAFFDQDQLVVRLRGSGIPDTAFSGDGIRVTSFTSGSEDQASGVAVLSDGKILTGGGAGSTFALARYIG